MAKSELTQSISTLSKKVDSLLDEVKSLRLKIASLEEINRKLIVEHDNDAKLLEQARKDIEFLSLSHRLASSPEALVSARNKISTLIRTIDNCIRMINED